MDKAKTAPWLDAPSLAANASKLKQNQVEREDLEQDFKDLEKVYQDEVDQFESSVSNRRRLGQRRRTKITPDQEKLADFFEYLDDLVAELYELAEENLEENFESWNKWFNKEKKNPPDKDPAQVFYVREEFNAKRSPHMWKSDPNRRWILAFGNNPINNLVSTNLFKYQNETISKDA